MSGITTLTEAKQIVDNYAMCYYGFCGIKLPPFIVSYPTKIDACAKVEHSKEDGMLNLLIHESSFGVHSRNLKPILFHEFTHIADMYEWDKKPNASETTISHYTEIHAASIELATYAGLNSITNGEQFSLSDEFFCINGMTSVERYIKDDHDELFTLATQANSSPKITKFVKHLEYYIGYLIACKKFCKDELPKEYLLLDELIPYCGFSQKALLESCLNNFDILHGINGIKFINKQISELGNEMLENAGLI